MFGIGKKNPPPRPTIFDFSSALDALIAEHSNTGDRQLAEILETRATSLRTHYAMFAPLR